MRTTLSAFTLLGLAAGCRTDPGTSEAVCLGQLESSSDGCEPEICIPEVQRVEVANQNPGTNDVFTCLDCIGLAPEDLSTDAEPKLMTVRYVKGAIYVYFTFDNRVTLDDTLDGLRNHAQTVGGFYDTHQGRMRFFTDQFEVVAYDGQNLHLRASVELHTLDYSEAPFPPQCQPLGSILWCAELACHYSDSAPGADGDPGELVIDLELPFVR